MKTKIVLVLWLCAGSLLGQNRNIDSLKSLLRQSSGEEKIKNLLELCWEYRFTSADTARQYGLEALKLARNAGNRDLEVEALHNLGVTHEAQGNYQDALRYELDALALRREIGDDPKTANTLNNIGIIHDEQGQYDKALEYYFEARRIYEKAGDQEKMGMIYLNIGVVLKAQEDYRRATGYYRHALEIYQRLGKKFGVAACYANLGSVYYYLPKYDSSLYYSLLATEEFQKQNIQQFLPTTMCNAGMAYDKLGQKDEAKKFLQKALQLNEEYDNKKEIAFTLIYLADVYRSEGNYADAAITVRRGLELAAKISAQQQVMEGQKVLADIYLDMNQHEKALTEFKRYVATKDTLFKEEKAKQIAELQTKYETEKKQSEIELLQKENDLKDSRLVFNQVVVVALIIIVVAIVLLGYLFRNRMALKQKVELEETKATLRALQLQAVITSQEEERRRFAADLHDGLGQLISAVRLNLSKEEVEKRSVDQAVEVLNEMNTEIRNIAFNLMPQVLIKSGLTEALDELAGRVNRSGKIRITVSAYDFQPIEETDKKVALYRVCQEWINNVIKYSGCDAINLQLVQHQNELVITIEDNGRGFDPQILSQSQGNGWKNINSRLAIIQGHIEVDSTQERKGTIAIITVPTSLAKAA
jgi:two-component system, NarL family, sensor kinase